ncbi:hypothetical protein PC121_g18551 [Phytophthora cactorum]|nr:hypothetical protein PC120_g22710 [Phytophthora cactorum]KAG3050150.1 hypothetical protein PC121_g18551 [Phytophthora cactorum]
MFFRYNTEKITADCTYIRVVEGWESSLVHKRQVECCKRSVIWTRRKPRVVKDRRKKVRKTQVKGKQTAYEARKEVKRDLVEKVKNLQKELGQLKFRLLVKQGEVDNSTKRT